MIRLFTTFAAKWCNAPPCSPSTSQNMITLKPELMLRMADEKIKPSKKICAFAVLREAPPTRTSHRTETPPFSQCHAGKSTVRTRAATRSITLYKRCSAKQDERTDQTTKLWALLFLTSRNETGTHDKTSTHDRIHEENTKNHFVRCFWRLPQAVTRKPRKHAGSRRRGELMPSHGRRWSVVSDAYQEMFTRCLHPAAHRTQDVRSEKAKGRGKGGGNMSICNEMETSGVPPNRFKKIMSTKGVGNVMPSISQRPTRLWRHRIGKVEHQSRSRRCCVTCPDIMRRHTNR